jgi:hypothetical protein
MVDYEGPWFHRKMKDGKLSVLAPNELSRIKEGRLL